MKTNRRQQRRDEQFREKQRGASLAFKKKREEKVAININDNLRDQLLRSFNVSFSVDPVPRFRTREEELEARLREANQKLQDQDTFLKTITEGALVIGTVIYVDGKRGTVVSGGNLISCNMPDGAKPGSRVRIIPKTSQPLDVIKSDIDVGEVCTVAAVHGDVIEISAGAGTRSIMRGGVDVEPGGRVVVDQSMHVALRSLGRASEAFLFSDDTSVSWDDIGGLEEAKEAIREAIEFPITHAELYRSYGRAPSRGVLLYGPPGCGKTMLGKATATALQRAHGSSAGGGFLYVKGPELLSKWVGETESTVRGLFQQARTYKARTGHSAVLFIDEAEALLSSRNADGFRGGIQQTLVPAFLAEMDGLEDSGAFVMLSTNRPDSLDSAVTRDGRIDRKVHVKRPGRAQSLQIFELAFSGKLAAVDASDLAKLACDTVFTGHHAVASASFGEVLVQLNLPDIMSGALATGIVNRAVDSAMRRDRAASCEPSGIKPEDIQAAIVASAKEAAHLDWREEMFQKATARVGSAALNAVSKIHSEAN